ncbi:hypothetical protein H9P43_002327 [Blastocladiella emersonii ATCC 22665]|nr:hypothetical protein H9P43_002327 [Blastocladiella emersonii ATCC 22665]
MAAADSRNAARTRWFFVSTRERYYRVVPPVGEFVPGKMALVIFDAIAARISGKRPEAGKSFFTLGKARYGETFATEVGEFVRMYDQQSTEWNMQYDRMHQYFGGLYISNELWNSFINPVLIVPLVFIMSTYVYPAVERAGVKVTPLRRMGLGFFLVAFSFVMSGFLQGIVINNFNGEVNDDGIQIVRSKEDCSTCVHGAWQLPQWFMLSLGEALFSPTGNEFAYTEVSKSLKAFAASFWLVTVALGNFIIVVFEEIAGEAEWAVGPLGTKPAKYYFYSAVAFAANVYFILYARGFRYRAQ